MWVIHLALSLAALYAAIIAAMYFAQTCHFTRQGDAGSASRFDAAS